MGLYAEFSIIKDWGFSTQLTQDIPGYPEFGEITVELDYSPACQVFINTFMDWALSFVPVDTGFLESTIDARADGDTCWAEAWADYAQYVEYGTSIMSAQPFFEDALETACGDAFFVALDIQNKGLKRIEEWMEEKQAIISELKRQEDLLNELSKPPEGEEGEEYAEEEEEYAEEEEENYYSELLDWVDVLLFAIKIVISMLLGIGHSKNAILSQGGGRLLMPEVIII